MLSTRSIVTTMLYGTGAHQRFVHDSPVTPDVWSAFLDEC